MLWVMLSLVIMMCLVWVLARKIQNPALIDVAWSVGLMMAALMYLVPSGTIRSFLIAFLVLIWGVRLAAYLYLSRIRKGEVDKRYISLSRSWIRSPWWGYFWQFQLQGVLIFFIALSFYFSANAPWSGWDALGVFLFLIGLVGEIFSDAQLQDFKKNNAGKVCDVGLWRYSRHPNYFFEWVIWCGFCCFALAAPSGWIGLVSPALLLGLMIFITVPITERGSIESRGSAYTDYQKKTSVFVPWFKSKSN